MSFDVNRYPQAAYRQTPVAWPVKAFNPPSQKPSSVVLNFDWTVYFALMNSAPNIAVTVDTNSGGTSQGPVIDKIVTAKIDNSNSTVPILVYFPDSGDLVTCPPQSVATLPCTTNASNCLVIAQGLTAGFTPQTRIQFYNYFVPPSVDPVLQINYPQWLGSPSVQRNLNSILTPGYGPPALGDQTANLTPLLDLRNVSPSPLNKGTVLPAKASGFYYLTCFDAILAGLDGQVGSNCFYDFFFEGILTGQVYHFFAEVAASTNYLQFAAIYLYSKTGMNLKLDATDAYQMRFTIQTANAVRSGFLNCILNFSYQP